MSHLARITMALALSIALGLPASAATYQIDPVHSSIGFSVSHLMVSKTDGVFTEYTGAIAFDPDNLESANFQATIQVSSIDTRNEKRDGHLRSPDFFDADSFPTIEFQSTALKGDGPEYVLEGNLTIRGVTRQLSLPVTISGPVQTPMGFSAIGISGQTVINRQDFGVSWNKQMDQGGLVVGDEVTIIINIEGHNP